MSNYKKGDELIYLENDYTVVANVSSHYLLRACDPSLEPNTLTIPVNADTSATNPQQVMTNLWDSIPGASPTLLQNVLTNVYLPRICDSGENNPSSIGMKLSPDNKFTLTLNGVEYDRQF